MLKLKTLDAFDKIQELRLLRGFSQGDLGNIVDVSFQQIQKYESGKNAVPINKLCAIAEALSVDASTLLPTPQATHDGEYDSDSETGYEMLKLMREYKKIKNKESRRAVYSLIKSLASSQDWCALGGIQV